MGKRTAQKDTITDITSNSQVNSNFPNRWSPASLTFNNCFYLFLYLYIAWITINNNAPHLKSPKNQNRRASRTIFLLNAGSKILERPVFNCSYYHYLLASLQPRFITGDSTINKVHFLYSTFCRAFNSVKQIPTVFCDISKAFDHVWHSGLLHKPHADAVRREALAWFRHYLSDRLQRIVIPSAPSDWALIRTNFTRAIALLVVH